MAESPGDQIRVGNISNAQGVAIGRQAHAEVTGDLQNAGGGDISPDELRKALMQLRQALADSTLPAQSALAAEAIIGNTAQEGVSGHDVNSDAMVSALQRAGVIVKQANSTIEEGSSLFEAVQRLALLVGPLVTGGSQAIAGWFGIHG